MNVRDGWSGIARARRWAARAALGLAGGALLASGCTMAKPSAWLDWWGPDSGNRASADVALLPPPLPSADSVSTVPMAYPANADLPALAPMDLGQLALAEGAGRKLGAPVPIQPTTAAPVAPPRQDRKIIYTAEMQLRVASKKDALAAIQALVEKAGGFVQRSTLDSITFRVPPEQFDPTLKSIESLGEVLSRQAQSQDVTENYVDLKMRLDVAQKSRDRLTALLERAEKAEDLLAIERDLRRLTEEIERIEGQLRLLSSKVDMSTITVNLVERAPETAPARRPQSPFGWIQEIQIAGALRSAPRNPSLDGGKWFFGLLGGPRLRLATPGDMAAPEGFVPLIYTSRELLAATATDDRLRARYFELVQKSDLDFWAKALETDLRQGRGWQVESLGEVALEKASLKARAFLCKTFQGGQNWNYKIWLIENPKKPKKLAVVEFAWLDVEQALLDKVDAAVAGARM